MSKPKFTSWHVEKCGGRIEINMGDYSIALRDSTEDMELAVFIAAAPEMYEVLQALVEWNTKYPASQTYHSVSEINRIGDLCNEICKNAENVLKKARGRDEQNSND